MSVIIKGMKMPEKCTACGYFYYEPLLGIQRCKLTNLFIEGYSGDFPKSCPLVELPEHHGRLIDENEVRIVMNYLLTQPFKPTWNDIYNAIQEMNAAIEAEGENK